MSWRRLFRLFGIVALAAFTVTAVAASTAQANYVILLNGKSVPSIDLGVEFFTGWVKTENGLKIECEGGEGTAHGELAEGGLKVVGSGSVAFYGCVWIGAEETCIINDGGAGTINTAGSGQIEMTGANEFVINTASPEYATIYTEGLFCTIPEEEVVSGSASVKLTEASKDLTMHTGALGAMNIRLGNSKIVETSATAQAWDLNNPNATFAIHLGP